jgi:hypothetical protein
MLSIDDLTRYGARAEPAPGRVQGLRVIVVFDEATLKGRRFVPEKY